MVLFCDSTSAVVLSAKWDNGNNGPLGEHRAALLAWIRWIGRHEREVLERIQGRGRDKDTVIVSVTEW